MTITAHNTASENGRVSADAFTGKEKDPETGYSYFDARYLDHEQMTTWLSVDPMADNYPSISPYNYCQRYKKETLKVEPCLGTFVLDRAIMIIRTEK